MSQEQTLSMIKPDAVSRGIIGQIYSRFEQAGFKIIAAKMLHLSQEQAEAFYAEHSHRPFFNDLVSFMISSPIMVQVLARDNAITHYRTLMGATNPQEATPGTIRADFATSIQENVVHGSDNAVNAQREIAFFFDSQDIFSSNGS